MSNYTNGIRYKYLAITAYKEVEDPEKWEDCPNCGLKPIVWEFDNGLSTACGCGRNKYDHFSIHAESVMSVVAHSRSGKSSEDYNPDQLMNNWNLWVKTGIIPFEKPKGGREDGRW